MLTHTQIDRQTALSEDCVSHTVIELVQHLEMFKPLLLACSEITHVLLLWHVMHQQNTGMHRDGGRF